MAITMTLPVIQCFSVNIAGAVVACADCCMDVGRPPYKGFARDRIGDPCLALDPITRLCRIYAKRPAVCAGVVPGDRICTYHRRKEERGAHGAAVQ